MEFFFLNQVQLSCDFGKVVPSGTTQGKVCLEWPLCQPWQRACPLLLAFFGTIILCCILKVVCNTCNYYIKLSFSFIFFAIILFQQVYKKFTQNLNLIGLELHNTWTRSPLIFQSNQQLPINYNYGYAHLQSLVVCYDSVHQFYHLREAAIEKKSTYDEIGKLSTYINLVTKKVSNQEKILSNQSLNQTTCFPSFCFIIISAQNALLFANLQPIFSITTTIIPSSKPVIMSTLQHFISRTQIFHMHCLRLLVFYLQVLVGIGHFLHLTQSSSSNISFLQTSHATIHIQLA